MDKNTQVLEEILRAREKRSRTQKELIHMFRMTLVSFTLNIPGSEKSNLLFSKVHEIGIQLLKEKLEKQNIRLVHEVIRVTADGDEAFFNIDAGPFCVKKITVAIEEEHELGRLFDFDVLKVSGEQISRRELGLIERKCLLCNDNAKVCGRGRKHSLEDLLNGIYKLIDNYNY